jgi:hypothetical protein
LIAAAIAGTLNTMMVPWTVSQSVSMQWRPDAIVRTGVVQPMWIRQLSPVDAATHTIDPFIVSVRGRGPAVSPYPAPEEVAYAAGKLAQLFANGRSGTVCIGTEKITVGPGTPPGGGIVGTITAAAQELARGGTVSIQIGSRRVVVCNSGPGGEPVLAPAAPTPTPNGAAPTEVATRPTPMTSDQQKTGFGQPPTVMTGQTVLPKVPGPGNVPQYPYLDYAYYYRKLNYDDNVWGRRNFQASIANRFMPNAISEMNQATSVPVRDAQRQADVPLDTRAPMVMKRWPHPEPVWPRQAVQSVAVRPEQR